MLLLVLIEKPSSKTEELGRKAFAGGKKAFAEAHLHELPP